MVNKKELFVELDEKFSETKEKLGFKASLDDIDGVYFVRDMILDCGYVSDDFARQMCGRMVSTYYSWVGQFQAWLTPGMGSVINHNEVKSLDEADIESVKALTHRAMYFFRADKVTGVNHDWKKMGELVDEMVDGQKDFFEKLAVLLDKVAIGWKED